MGDGYNRYARGYGRKPATCPGLPGLGGMGGRANAGLEQAAALSPALRPERNAKVSTPNPAKSTFVRLLALLFTTVVATQAVTFALVLAMPTPAVQTTKVSAIVAALKSGTSAGTMQVATRAVAPADNWQDPTESAFAARIAHDLAVRSTRVRVVSRRRADEEPGPPPPDGPGGPGGGLEPPSNRIAFPAVRDSSPATILTGDDLANPFEVGLRQHDGRWRVASSSTLKVERWQWEVLLWLLASAIVVAPFAWFFARRIVEPIATFSRAADRLGLDPRSEPVAVRGPPEITAAATAINRMQERLRRYVEERLLMVGSMAHDLRTPLMRLALLLQDGPDAIRHAGEAEIREIDQMAAGVLALVRDHSHTPKRQRLALRSLIETVVEEIADIGQDASLLPGIDVEVEVDVPGIRRLLTNVIENAVVYGSEARVELTATDEAAIVEVRDRGPGLSDENLERVFEPFYRGEPSRNRKTGGIGLGLASARAIARAHGGDVTLANHRIGGLLALVTIPR